MTIFRFAVGTPTLQQTSRDPKKTRFFGRFLRRTEGATVVEFGLVAVPFFALMFMIFETALVFFASQALDGSISRAARMIRTGQVQAGGLSESGFKDLICADTPAIFDCASSLKVDVRSFPNFGAIALPAVVDGNGDLTNNFTFSPGASSEVVVVRAYYPWTLITPSELSGLSTMSGNKRLLSASAAFRNEPF
jgi:Flp pilus assembly protein TadG